MMDTEEKPQKRRSVEKRQLDNKLTDSLRKLYDPMLEEPVPEQLIEILRRAMPDKSSS
jgi:Anti-sigma factor NepR